MARALHCDTCQKRSFMPIRLMIVAEHDLSVEAFRALLAQAPELAIVGGATSRADAVSLARREQPDAAVAVDLPADGLGVVEALAALTRIVVVGVRDEGEAQRALAAGARGVVAKTQTSADLVAAVSAVARGETSSPSWPEASETALPASARLARLTARERQVFDLLIQGETNATIGARLGISAKTVDTHRTHVMRKLGVHSVIHLVRFAARHQLLVVEPDARSALA